MHVARAYREQDPARPIIIAGDYDHHLPRREQQLPNTGVEKAKAAAKEVGGIVIVPSFEPDDTGTDWNYFGTKNGAAALRATLAKSLGESGLKVSLQPLESAPERSRFTQSQGDAARTEKQTAHGRKKASHERGATRRPRECSPLGTGLPAGGAGGLVITLRAGQGRWSAQCFLVELTRNATDFSQFRNNPSRQGCREPVMPKPDRELLHRVLARIEMHLRLISLTQAEQAAAMAPIRDHQKERSR